MSPDGLSYEGNALDKIADETRAAGLEIISAKGATYFGIGGQTRIAELGYNGRKPWLAGTREANEHDEIDRTLKDTKGRVGGHDGAAPRMGIKRTTLISRVEKLGIDRARYREPASGTPA